MRKRRLARLGTGADEEKQLPVSVAAPVLSSSTQPAFGSSKKRPAGEPLLTGKIYLKRFYVGYVSQQVLCYCYVLVLLCCWLLALLLNRLSFMESNLFINVKAGIFQGYGLGPSNVFAKSPPL